MEAIKHSRIIVVLLILYIGISILVVTLDNANKKNKKSSSNNNTEEKDVDYNKFISEVDNISDEVISFLYDNNITYDTCIKLSEVMGDEYTGSVYVSENGESIKMWYSNGTHAVNNIETNKTEVVAGDVEDNYTTEYYNNCGLSE